MLTNVYHTSWTTGRAMQDDSIIAVDGWEGAQPREIVQVRTRDNKHLAEPHDY